jgi:type I restriction enzyme S subunit
MALSTDKDGIAGAGGMGAALRAGYKQTEVGVIPEDWEVVTLGEIANTSSGTTPARDLADRYYRNGTVHWVKTLDLNNSELLDTDEKVTDIAVNETCLRPYPIGTVLVAMYGGFNQIGRTGLIRIPAAVNQAITAIQPHVTKLQSEYLLATLNFRVSYWKSVASSSRKDPNITSHDVRAFPIARPPLPEQRAIATALSDVDAMLEGLERVIAKKRDIKQGTMQALLTGQTRLPGFSGEWDVKRLGEVASFFKGKGLPKSELSQSGSEPCIHYGELFTRYPETIKLIISRTNGLRDAFRSVANDVLMPTSDVTPRGLAKASCVTVDGVILGGDILVIRSDLRRVNGSFLSYVIRREEDQVLQLVSGSTVFHLYGSDMKKFTFQIPSLPEQTAIATILSDMDTEIAALEARRDKARTLKQGMMQALLTGRVRLPHA